MSDLLPYEWTDPDGRCLRIRGGLGGLAATDRDQGGVTVCVDLPTGDEAVLMARAVLQAAGSDARVVCGQLTRTPVRFPCYREPGHAGGHQAAAPDMTALVVPDSPKMLGETLAVAQTALGQWSEVDRRDEHIARLGRLAAECVRHRPVGADGKHRDLHTATCGCEDKGPEAAHSASEQPLEQPEDEAPDWRIILLDAMGLDDAAEIDPDDQGLWERAYAIWMMHQGEHDIAGRLCRRCYRRLEQPGETPSEGGLDLDAIRDRVALLDEHTTVMSDDEEFFVRNVPALLDEVERLRAQRDNAAVAAGEESADRDEARKEVERLRAELSEEIASHGDAIAEIKRLRADRDEERAARERAQHQLATRDLADNQRRLDGPPDVGELQERIDGLEARVAALERTMRAVTDVVDLSRPDAAGTAIPAELGINAALEQRGEGQ
jgi:hypothetical protein